MLKATHRSVSMLMVSVVVPLNQLLAQHDLGALHFDQLLVVIMDDGLLQLLLLLLRHGDWVGGWGVGLIV